MKRTECIRSTVAVRFRSPPSSASTQTLSPLGRLPELQHLWYRPLTLSGGGTITRSTDEGFQTNNLESFPRMGGGDALGLVGVSIGLRGPLPRCFPTFPRERRRENPFFPRLLRSIEVPGTIEVEQASERFEPIRPGPLGFRHVLFQQGRHSVVHQPRNPDTDSGQPSLSTNR